MFSRFFILTCLTFIFVSAHAAKIIDISGEWQFSSDKEFTDIQEGKVYLPGDVASQGFGKRPNSETKWLAGFRDEMFKTENLKKYLTSKTDFKLPCFLQPDMYFSGKAYFEKSVDVPEKLLNSHFSIFLERPHLKTSLWLNGVFIGSNMSAGTAHIYDVSKHIKAGENKIKILVENDNPIDLGRDSHSISDHTQGNWNGIAGRMQLIAKSPIFIQNVQILETENPNVRKFRIKINSFNSGKRNFSLTISATPLASFKPAPKTIKQVFLYVGKESYLEVLYSFGDDPEYWSEFAPKLYEMEIEFKSKNLVDTKKFNYGLRTVAAKENKILVNGLDTYFRGTLDCCIFPLTGYPPTDKESWIKIMETCKSYGLNHIRFHSWCPPKAAFEAADEIGFYLQIENSNWPVKDFSRIGMGNPIDDWIFEETKLILASYANHPSFILYSQGNEPHGEDHRGRDAFLKKWLETFKNKDTQRLYSAGSGWPLLAENQFHLPPNPRIQGWGEGLKSVINANPPNTKFNFDAFVNKYPTTPVITHEMGQWCAYPNFESIKKYTGNLKNRSFEIFKDLLDEAGLSHRANDFYLASGKLQLLCYKADIEAALRTENLRGYQLLGLQDFTGQGTALVGVLDPFWESKEYASNKDFSKFSNSLVPLALFEKMVFSCEEKISAQIKISNFTQSEIKEALITYTVKDSDDIELFSKSFETDLPHGLNVIKDFNFDTSALIKASQLKFIVEIKSKQINVTNDWVVYYYPKAKMPEPKFLIFESMNEDFFKALNADSKIWLKLKPSKEDAAKYGAGFSSIFWNTLWTSNQEPHTMGILCNPKHPALKNFPTNFHSDYQWWDVIKNSTPLRLDSKITPIVAMVPDWYKPMNLALCYEVKIGKSKLFVSNIDFGLQTPSPVLKQMELSITEYLNGTEFEPTQTIPLESSSKIGLYE